MRRMEVHGWGKTLPSTEGGGDTGNGGCDVRDRADGRAILVEFLGMPGSGKSTLARELEKQLRERDHRVHLSPGMPRATWREVKAARGMRRKLWRVARMLAITTSRGFRYPGIALWHVRMALARSERETGISVLDLTHFQRTTERFHVVRKAVRTRGIHLFQGGAGLKATANLASHDPGLGTRHLVPSLRGSDVSVIAVLVECDPQALQERLRSRRGHPRSRAQALDPVTFRARMDGVEFRHAFAERLQKEGTIPGLAVVRVDNSSEEHLTPAVTQILRAIEGGDEGSDAESET